MAFDPKEVFATFSTTTSENVCLGEKCERTNCDFMQTKDHPKPYLKHVEATLAKRKSTIAVVPKKPAVAEVVDVPKKPAVAEVAEVPKKSEVADVSKIETPKAKKIKIKTPKKEKDEIKPKKTIKHKVNIGVNNGKPVVYVTTTKPCYRGLKCEYDGCIFDHPNCPDGKKCSKTICNGKGHVARRPCRKGLDCDYNGCIFEHPTCVDGLDCNTIYCPGVHPKGHVAVCTNENPKHIRTNTCKFRHVRNADRRLMKK